MAFRCLEEMPVDPAKAVVMQRLVHNVISVPRRAWLSLSRRFDPAYRLQLQADREVPRWLSAERRRQLEAIGGTSSSRENRLLAHLVRIAPAGGCIVEIGAYQGKSTAWLVEAAQQRPDRPVVVSIDPHQLIVPGQGCTWELFQLTVARFDLERRGLEVIRANSAEAGKQWRRPLSFLWVDGSHEYDDVVRDIEAFTPHLVPGGWVVFDDAHGGQFPGVERALAERMVGRPGFYDIGTVKHFRVFRRAV
jgi:predicted O-methyltransferase YrrM